MRKGLFIFRYLFVLALLLLAESASVSAKSLVVPRPQAAHFCQLLLNDGRRISSLSSHARQFMHAEDSLSIEQLFAGFILQDANWQGMRFFPHHTSNGVMWYSAADELPVSMSAEHQKYIHEVFPRMIAQAEAGNWDSFDAYIDKMLQYQCQFGGNQADSAALPSHLVFIAIFFIVVVLVSRILFVSLSPKRIE